MLPHKIGKIYVGHTCGFNFIFQKGTLESEQGDIETHRQPICTPWFVIRLVPLWEFSETLNREAIILSTPHTMGAGVRTWSLEAVQLNLRHNTGLEHVGLVGSGPDTAKAIVPKSCQKQPAAQRPGCWGCTADSQWTAQISGEGKSQTALAKLLNWSRECSQLFPSTCRILSYVRFWVSCKPLPAWPRPLEWVRMKCWCDPVRELCVHGGQYLEYWLLCSLFLPCFGPWGAEQEGLYQLAPLLCGFQSEGPVGALARDPLREESGRKCFSSRLPAERPVGSHSTGRCSSQVSFSDFGSNSHPFPSPLQAYLGEWQHTTSPALGHCLLPHGFPSSCL